MSAELHRGVHGLSPRAAARGPVVESRSVALVTGGGRGVGRAVAVGLGMSGFKVAVMGRSAGELDETHALLEQSGVPAAVCVADVRDVPAVTRSVAAVEETLGPISTLVNNAGTSVAVGPMWEVDPGDWWTDVNTSLGGTFNLCSAVIPRMIARQHGRILNVSSYAGTRAAPYQSGYGCAKAAVTSLTESLAASLSAYCVRVFAVTPGFVHTDLTRRLMDSPEGQWWLPEAKGREGLDIGLFVRLCVTVALGKADALNGRFLHALDDVDDLLRRLGEVEGDDLYVPRLRRLPSDRCIKPAAARVEVVS
jgi:NAD(P)-dependent dehydrogenase (short-subunit alcohol dehydrogenase family)